MRKQLKKIEGERELFIAKFVREGTKSGYKGSAAISTILLRDVRRVSDGELMTDHLWLNKTKAKRYSKGYKGKRLDVKKEVQQDFKLSHPTQVEVIGKFKKNKATRSLIIRKKRESSSDI